jgi:hypothetical protein
MNDFLTERDRQNLSQGKLCKIVIAKSIDFVLPVSHAPMAISPFGLKLLQKWV